jgi:hypothetical protein
MAEVTIIATVLSPSVNQIYDKGCSWQLAGHRVQQRQRMLALFYSNEGLWLLSWKQIIKSSNI